MEREKINIALQHTIMIKMKNLKMMSKEGADRLVSMVCPLLDRPLMTRPLMTRPQVARPPLEDIWI